MNPVVVKEVFNRLLGLHGESPITPIELLVALHVIDTNKADLKTVIKAISVCTQEKQVFVKGKLFDVFNLYFCSRFILKKFWL